MVQLGSLLLVHTHVAISMGLSSIASYLSVVHVLYERVLITNSESSELILFKRKTWCISFVDRNNFSHESNTRPD